jgi:hypothetical protein
VARQRLAQVFCLALQIRAPEGRNNIRMRVGSFFSVGLSAAGLLLAGLYAPVMAQGDRAFERELFKTRFEHEVKFRAAAIEVAWAAEALCDSTTQIEPFVLWSVHALRRRMSDADLALFRDVTGMDERWRVVWMDEAAPDDMRLGDVVVAINGRPLPGRSTRFDLGAVFRGASVVSVDDQDFWNVVLQARAEAKAGKPYTATMASGRVLTVETQGGCAGSVTASAFDADADIFWRQGTQRAKIPANAMIEARSSDEFRWLAAFGTYFQASKSAMDKVQQSEGRSTGFLVGKILTMTVPGAGMLLSAVEAQAEKSLTVDSIVGSADLFANEVVAALGGDAAAGLNLSQRMAALGMKVDAVMMDDFRRSNAAEHARRIKAIQAQEAARAHAAEQAREAVQRQTPAPLQPVPGRR